MAGSQAAAGGEGGTPSGGSSTGGSGGSGSGGGKIAGGSGPGGDGGAPSGGGGTTSVGGAASTPTVPFVGSRLASMEGGNCVIEKDHRLTCWGPKLPFELDVTVKYVQVSGQYGHMCAIMAPESATAMGNIWCAANDALYKSRPTGTFAEVRASEHSACARKADNTLTCWTDGNADAAPIVDGTPSAPVKSFYVMWNTGCGVMAGSGVQCWGMDLDVGPRLVPKRMDYLALGGYQDLFGIAPDGSISGWGLDNLEPDYPEGTSFVQVVEGTEHTAALHKSGKVYAVGNDAVDAPDGVSFVEISAGDGQTCGITTAGGVMCWGRGTTAEFKAPERDVHVF